jgi:hypothetical protein
MTSKMMALRILDLAFMAFTAILLLAVVGVPIEGLLDLIDMSPGEFQGFVLFVLFGVLWLIHAIGTSDSAP